MDRRLLVLCLLAAAGCRTCDNPYDHCGPVVDAGFHPMGFRAGGGMSAPRATPEVIPAPSSPSPQSPPPNIEPYDVPPPMDEMETTSVMRSRPRYAR